MDARLERNLQTLTVIVACGACAGLIYNVPRGGSVAVGLGYGILMSAVLGATELFVLGGPMRDWLSRFSFTVELAIRSAIYAVIIAALQWLQPGEILVGLPPEAGITAFWYGFAYSAGVSVLINVVFAITNLIGARSFLNFITGRYHTPVEESRFVLFVDIAGSTGLAERLGGVVIHRFLDRTFRLLTDSVVDYRGGGAQLCRRRSDRNLAGAQRVRRQPAAALLCGDARGVVARGRPVRKRIPARRRRSAAACITVR